MKLTIAFITGRARPHLEWLCASLMPQMQTSDEIEILVIDRLGRTAAELETPTDWGSHVRVTLPKPTPWQGAHRVTSCDYWAKSSAINTALVLCDTDYIAFVDDCGRLSPSWLETVRRGDRERQSVLAGTYDKLAQGTVIAEDHRRQREPTGKTNCGGGWLYGCTFALPLEWALETNGAEEGCDGMGAEDYIFGLMLENNGHRIDFVPSMAIALERGEIFTCAESSSIRRTGDKGVSPNDKSHAALARFRVLTRTEFSPDLRALRARRAAGALVWPLPDPNLRDWYDGQLIREF